VVLVKRDGWTYLTNHGHVLVCLATDPQVRLRDVAAVIGITERAVQQIVGDLERAGVIVRLRVGRRNHYLVCREKRFRHPVEARVTVGDLVDIVQVSSQCPRRVPAPRAVTPPPTTLAPVHHIDWATEARATAQPRHQAPSAPSHPGGPG
jgi:hypothetical protein